MAREFIVLSLRDLVIEKRKKNTNGPLTKKESRQLRDATRSLNRMHKDMDALRSKKRKTRTKAG